MKYIKHVFVCINQKDNGKTCCGSERGLEIVNTFKEKLKTKGILDQIRINKSGCLDACAYGPSTVIYPEGIWYGGLTIEDIDLIIEDHLINNKPLSNISIDFNVSANKYLQKRDSNR